MEFVRRKLRGLNTRPHPMMQVAFLPVFALIHFAAYWLRFDGDFTEKRWFQLTCTLIAVLVIKTICFGKYKIYHSWSRFVTFYDLVKLTQAATVSAVCLSLVDYLFLADLHTPRSVFFMDWGATLVVVGGLRSFRRWMSEGVRLLETSNGTPVLIVGADDFGETLLRCIRLDSQHQYHVVGFVAAHEQSVGTCIGGVPVLGLVDDTANLAESYGVTEVLIAGSSLTGKQVRRLIEATRHRQVSVKLLPSYQELLDGRVNLKPRTVSIADLLQREPVDLDMDKLRQWLEGRVLLVTGAAGSIGSEICRQLLQFRPARLVVVDRSENGQFFLEQELRRAFPNATLDVLVADIADHPRMCKIFRDYQPAIVFHAAAYKHVPLMETNCAEGVKNIPLATKVLADLADEHHVHSFVMISTDKAVNPTSVMGASKRVAEIYVQALAAESTCRFVTVRFGNVLGSNGSVVPIFREQIERGGPVTVTHPEMRRYFMTIPEASQLVIQAGAMGNGGEIFVLDMGDPVKIVDLAKDMIRLSGLREGDDVEIRFCGTRPGEKLFEELHIDGERHVPTAHPKILVAQCQQTPLEEIVQSLRELRRACDQGDERVVAELERIVHEFQPARTAATRKRAA